MSHADLFWRTRTLEHARKYWETRVRGYRALLASMLHAVAPFGSLMEVGCQSGPNLWAIRQQFPSPQLLGLDPNEHSVCFGAAMCHTEGLKGIDFFQGSAPDGLDVFTDVDVVLTCYTLAYLDPASLHATLTKMVALAGNAIVLAEPMPLAGQTGLIAAGAGTVRTARHDYAGWFHTHAPEWTVEVRAFPPVQDLDGVLIAKAPAHG